MAYVVIELLSLSFALNPLFCKTDVSGCGFLSAVSGRVSAEKIKKSGRKNFCLCRVGKGQALLQTLVGALACSGL